jgi:8-amino-7-oxononanoate synthase
MTSPIAIVGLSCRFAGARDATAFWDLLRAGKDSFTPVPADRWPEAMFRSTSSRDMDRTTAPHGAFVDDIQSFPALALGIPPRRVEVMDPQQRLALVCAIEAAEDAGYRPEQLPRNTGVFVGITAHEYRVLQSTRVAAMLMASGHTGRAPDDLGTLADAVERIVPPRPFTAPGSLGNMSAAIVAQELDLHGPAYTTDAACASAHIALHDAVLQLRAGTIDAALAGGAYIQLTPEHYIAFSRIGAMSDQGRCLPFDARADGFVQGDGVGLVLLKRLDDALRDGDRIYATIEGVALNNDGRGEGPMAPVQSGQQAVIEAAWRDAALPREAVSYIEAHGTGTSVGDGIEFQSLMENFRGAKRIGLGSAKANIGHTMSAAGIAGVLKAVLSIHHREMPPLAGFETPKADLDLENTPFFVPTAPTPWSDERRLTGVSSFGFGGTNGHIVLAAPPAIEAPTPHVQQELVALSAGSAEALQRHAGAIAAAVRADRTITVAAVARTLAGRRALAHRATLVAADRDGLLEALDALHAGTELPAGARAGETGPAPKIAYLFPGQGAQRPGMLRDLRERFAVVDDTLDALEQALDGELERPLSHLMDPSRRPEPVTDAVARAELTATENTQPAMFAAGYALARLLDSVGLTPVAVTGHSLGEFVAAACAAVLPAEEAIRFVARRGRAMAALDGDHGAMAAVMTDAASATPFLVPGAVIANVNHPRQVVVSGATDAVAEVVARATAAGVQAKPLDVSHAFHSPILDRLDAAALCADLTFAEPRIPVASGILDRAWCSASDARDVFLRHATSPVIFTGALQQCVDAGADVLLQVGAGGPLASFARGTLAGGPRMILTLASLEDDDGGRSLLDTLGALWIAGAPVDLSALHAEAGRALLPPTPLPTETYWAVKDVVTRPLKFEGVVASPRPTIVAAVAAPATSPVSTEPAGPQDDALDRVIRVVAKVSAYPAAALRPSARLVEDLGFDSLMMGDLATGIADAFPEVGGIPQDLLVNSPTVDTLVQFVRGGARASAPPVDDDAPLHAWRPIWSPAPLTAVPSTPAPSGAWWVTGPDEAVAETARQQLGAIGVAVVGGSDVPSPSPAAVIWVGPTATPRVRTVLAGKAPTLDEAGDILALAARLEAVGYAGALLAVSDDDDPWAAGVSGALSALAADWPDVRVKHVRLTQRADLAAAVFGELTTSDRTTVSRWNGRTRQITSFTQDASSGRPLVADDVVAITGGTRGIGLKLGLRLAADVKAVLLLGRACPAEADAAAIAAFGNVRHVPADVTDAAATKAALLRQGVTVLVHAAGALADGPVSKVDPATGRAARRVKVDGLLHAVRAAGASLRDVVVVGSLAGRFGNRHQTHYAAANALAAALIDHLPVGVAGCVAEFGPWTTSDMAKTIPAPVQAAMRADGVDFVGDEAGLGALCAAIGTTGVRTLARRAPPTLRHVCFDRTLDTATDPFLLDHAVQGVPVFPLAGAADLIAQAAACATPYAITGLTLYQGITVRTPVTVRVEVKGDRATLRQGPQRALAYQARIVPLDADPADVPAPSTGGDPSPIDRERFYAEATFHGPLLAGITAFDAVGPDFIRGRVHGTAPSTWTPGSAQKAFALDPLAIDSAMQLTASVAWTRYQRAGTPVGIDRIEVYGPLAPNAGLHVDARFGPPDGNRFRADITLRTEDGAVWVRATGVTAELRQVQDDVSPNEAEPSSAVAPEASDITLWPEVQAIQARIAEVAAAGIPNPYFHVHEGTARNTTVVGGRRLINFSSYNYIGLSGDPDVLAATHAAIERYGTSVSASRVASGERPFHGELEALLARAQGAEDAILFTAGHATNVTTIGHLFGPEDLILHDEYIHDSAFQGIKLSGAQRRMFRHEDTAHLDKQLTDLRKHYRRCLIVVEGVYSMDGDICDLPSYVALKKKHHALLMVDEAHSFGIVGATGRGVAEHHGIDGREVDIWMGTLSKSLSSCGGWIAGSKPLIQLLRYTAPGFVYSAGLTAANGVAALASLKKMLAEPWRVRRLQDNASLFQRTCAERGLDTGPARGGTGVVPVITGNSVHAMMLSASLRDQGINVQPIVYPAVPDDAARLRFFLSSTHTDAELLETATRVADTLAAIRAAHPAPAAAK